LKHQAIAFAVPWKFKQFAGARFYDLRDKHLRDQTLFIELGCYEGPHVNTATEDDNDIRTRHRIGNDPEISRFLQQSRAFKPDPGNKDND
jgi:hypothetical protein